MQKFYISDTHFGHEAVIRMSERPFQSIEEMDQTIIDNWNRVVSEQDEVYIVGDLIYRAKQPPKYYLEQLKGRKHLVLGNHERWTKKVDLLSYFDSVNQILEISDQSKHIILCHFPMAEWPRYYRGSLHIFGHIHNRRECDAFRYYQSNANMFNAGVDINHFTPVILQQLIDNNAVFRQNIEIG